MNKVVVALEGRVRTNGHKLERQNFVSIKEVTLDKQLEGSGEVNLVKPFLFH